MINEYELADKLFIYVVHAIVNVVTDYIIIYIL